MWSWLNIRGKYCCCYYYPNLVVVVVVIVVASLLILLYTYMLLTFSGIITFTSYRLLYKNFLFFCCCASPNPALVLLYFSPFLIIICISFPLSLFLCLFLSHCFAVFIPPLIPHLSLFLSVLLTLSQINQSNQMVAHLWVRIHSKVTACFKEFFTCHCSLVLAHVGTASTWWVLMTICKVSWGNVTICT